MTEKETWQQQEIERLQKKLRSLSEAYSDVVGELEQLKKGEKKVQRKGRPPISPQVKNHILALYRQGHTMRNIAGQMGVALSTVHKVIAKAGQESRIVYVYLDRGEPATLIDTYSFTRKVQIVNFTDDMLSRAFGIKETPGWKDWEAFLESRCMPHTRYGIREELKYMGLDAYDPFQIVEKTKGRVYGDGQSLERMREEWTRCYDEIREAVKGSEELKERLYHLLVQEKGKWEA